MNRIIVGDCIRLLAKIRDKSVDLVFADPPYNLMLKNPLRRPDGSRVIGVSEDWDKFESFAAYDQFTRAWLHECQRILKPTGSIVVIGSYHNIFRLGVALQDLGYWIQNDIVWRKTNPTPNFAGKRLTNAHETMIWASPSSSKAPKFNYKALKSGNDDAQLRSDWLLPICQGAERLRDSDGKSVHPTQKPLSLIERVIVMTTDAGDIVMDPFSGTGTTGVASIHLKRQFLGFERDQNYAAAANRRLESTKPYSITPAPEPAPVKYPTMIELVGAGAIVVGDLFEARTRTGTVEARVLSTGELTTATQKGSIHMLARDLGVPQTNGWLAWSLVRGSARIPIDQIRKGGAVDRLTPLVPLTPTAANAEQIRRRVPRQQIGPAQIPRPIATVRKPAYAPSLSVPAT